MRFLSALALMAIASHAMASELPSSNDKSTNPIVSVGDKFFYGWHAGEEATVASVSGLNTSHSKITIKITEKNAIAACNAWPESKADPTCVQVTMTYPYPNHIYANCLTGDFVDFRKTHYHFEGEHVIQPNETLEVLQLGLIPRWNIREKETNTILEGYHSTGYENTIGIYRYLCPASVHGPDFYY